jgi:hypothetical protein
MPLSPNCCHHLSNNMDWSKLLDDNHIHYVTRGPNTKRGEVSIKCPWCGSDDPSEHLGINLETSFWGCHRNQAHRGKGAKRLIQALLGCSATQANLVIAQYDRADPEALETPLFAETEPPVKVTGALKLPPEVRDIPPNGRFYDYIRSRGYENPLDVCRTYNLKSASTGRWKDRIIIPIYADGTALVAWTARAISRPVSAPRYLSEGPIKEIIFNLQQLIGGYCLFITEGPFDAMKVDFYGRVHGSDATAVFGTSITPNQISLLRQVSKRYTNTIILLDPDAVESTFSLSEWLPGAIIGNLPEGVADPGDLTKSQVIDLIKMYN